MSSFSIALGYFIKLGVESFGCTEYKLACRSIQPACTCVRAVVRKESLAANQKTTVIITIILKLIVAVELAGSPEAYHRCVGDALDYYGPPRVACSTNRGKMQNGRNSSQGQRKISIPTAVRNSR